MITTAIKFYILHCIAFVLNPFWKTALMMFVIIFWANELFAFDMAQQGNVFVTGFWVIFLVIHTCLAIKWWFFQDYSDE